MKSIDYYVWKREEAQARIVQIDKLLSSNSKEVRWKCDAYALRSERATLNGDIKGYNCIISSLESGIDVSRYQNKELAYRILKREKEQGG